MKKFLVAIFLKLISRLALIAIKNNSTDPLFITKILEKLNFLLGKGFGGQNSIKIETDYVKSYLNQSSKSILIDAGANKGAYSDFLINDLYNYELVLFEPNKENYKILLSKYKKNNKVLVENLGLSNKSINTKLYSDTEGSGMASLSKRKMEHFNKSFEIEERVKVIKFYDYWVNNFKDKRIDLLKLDIEGHEMYALEGCEDMVKNIKLIQFEFGGCNIDSKTYFQDFWYFFHNNNFDIYRMSPIKLLKINKYSEADEFFITTNFLAINKAMENKII